MHTQFIRIIPACLCFFTVACMQQNPTQQSTQSSSASSDSSLPTVAPQNGAEAGTSSINTQSFRKPTDAQLRQSLSEEQFDVTQRNGTEAPFHNAYWNNHEDGIYVDIVSGEPLFSSKDKYDSGTGWPSFTQPLVHENVVEKTDGTLLMPRTEVRSKMSDDHLGHVFTDGPLPSGLRYCMNSAALRFIPKENLEKDGYGQYATLFQ